MPISIQRKTIITKWFFTVGATNSS